MNLNAINREIYEYFYGGDVIFTKFFKVLNDAPEP
jgi:hypothetical protein